MLNLFDRIQPEHNSFSKQQRAICECILEKGLEVAFMSAKQLAEASNTSPATVVRFTKRLGYSSYLDFTAELHQMIVKDYRPMGKLREAMESRDSTKVSLEHTVAHENNSISAITKLNTEEVIHEITQQLCKARKIYITGARSAYTLVYYFGFLLRELVNNVVYFRSSADDAFEQLEVGSKEDLLFMISFRRYARSSHHLIQFGRQKGLKIVGLTDVPNSPLCRFCDLILFAPNNTPFYSYTAAMSLINSLIWGFASTKGDDLLESLHKRQRMLLEQDVFV